MIDVGQAHLESQSFQICPSYCIGPILNLPLTWNCIPNRVALALNIALVWSCTLHRIDLHLYDDYADVTHCDGIYLALLLRFDLWSLHTPEVLIWQYPCGYCPSDGQYSLLC